MTAKARADLLLRRCECPMTLAAPGMPSGPVLTTAERDTALLAARGDTNREIAEKMYLSVRTVENRLRRVYQKLAVANRAELNSVLHGDVPATSSR